jgi:Ca2+-binding RTX toxin-like protein
VFAIGFTVHDAYANIFTASQSGNWNDPNTWGVGVPTATDDAVILSGIVVTVDQSTEIGAVTNSGTLLLNDEFIASGIIINNGDIQQNALILWTLDNDLNNFGSIINNNEISFNTGITVTNSGTITNNGNLVTNAIVETSGSFDNFGTIDNDVDGDFQNLSGSTFINHSSGQIANFGFITNYDSFTNNGDIANSGTITNNGVFTNNNSFIFDCDGVIIGTITGTQPLEICSANPPVFTSFPTDIVTSTDAGKNYAIVIYPFPTAVDGIFPSDVELTAGLPSNSKFPLGVTINTFRATDADGQTTTQSFTVTVNDNEPPVISGIPADITILLPTREASIPVLWTPPTASDNIGITSFTSTHDLGDLFLPGTTTVTYTATDAAGNITTASFNVIINETPVELFCGLPIEEYDSVISGTIRDDRLNGSQGNDLIFGGDGHDKINGLSGNDCIYGENGNDKINGNNGMDEIHGGNGNDLIIGNNDDDKLFGDDGKDKIQVNNGDDFIDGGENSDYCKGGNGANTIINCEKDDDHDDDHDDSDDRLWHHIKGRFSHK